MLPAGQRLDALEPGADVLVRAWDVETELVGRIVEIRAERNVGDGRALAQDEALPREPLVEDRKIAVDAGLQKRHHGGIAGGPREVLQKPIGTEKAVDL